MYKITRDLINEKGHKQTGKYFAVPFWETNEQAKEKIDTFEAKPHFKFRLLDDDRKVYFHGENTNSSSFQPLDDIGQDYGCTIMEYFENERWEVL